MKRVSEGGMGRWVGGGAPEAQSEIAIAAIAVAAAALAGYALAGPAGLALVAVVSGVGGLILLRYLVPPPARHAAG